ncbi:MAG: hypothetical protein ACKO3B_01770 [Bacteroidota bacterium]
MKKHVIILMAAGLMFFSISCVNEDPVAFAPLDELSKEARGFFGVQNGYSKATQAAGNSMVNQSYRTNLKTLSGSGIAATGDVKGDSTIVSDPIPWVSCAVNTQMQNDDGSITYTVDYGDGCTEGYGDYKYFMFGKYAYTWKSSESRKGAVISYDYFSHGRTDGYGGIYYFEKDTVKWATNGRSYYDGSSTYDTLKQTFSSRYSYSDSSEYTYNGIAYRSRAMGKSSYDEKKSVVEYNVKEYRNGPEFYRNTVLRPLIAYNDCIAGWGNMKPAADSRMMWWPAWVSGRERIEYERDGKTGMFEIDYGDGTCDSIILIYENGKVFKVDMGTDFGIFTKG